MRSNYHALLTSSCDMQGVSLDDLLSDAQKVYEAMNCEGILASATPQWGGTRSRVTPTGAAIRASGLDMQLAATLYRARPDFLTLLPWSHLSLHLNPLCRRSYDPNIWVKSTPDGSVEGVPWACCPFQLTLPRSGNLYDGTVHAAVCMQELADVGSLGVAADMLYYLATLSRFHTYPRSDWKISGHSFYVDKWSEGNIKYSDLSPSERTTAAKLGVTKK